MDRVPTLLLCYLSEPAGYTCATSSSPGMCVEENHVTLTRQLVSQPNFEPDASHIQVKYIIAHFYNHDNKHGMSFLVVFITFISWGSLRRNLCLGAPGFCRPQASYLVICATLLNDIHQPARQHTPVFKRLSMSCSRINLHHQMFHVITSFLIIPHRHMITSCSKFYAYCQ